MIEDQSNRPLPDFVAYKRSSRLVLCLDPGRSPRSKLLNLVAKKRLQAVA